MTLPLPSAGLLPLQSVTDSSGPNRPERGQEGLEEAAQQFESLLVQQLWQAMRKTVGGAGFGGGGAAGADTYMHFLDEAVATQLSAAGGIGLASIMTGEAADQARPVHFGASTTTSMRTPEVRRPAVELGPSTGVRMDGATGALQNAARELLAGPSAARFGREGRLTRVELASRFQTEHAGGMAAFNVHDAAGFEGEYKCNLFAFEMVRRAGFQTPIQGRRHGWGYPSPDAVTADAADGRLRRDWGRVVTGESANELDAGARSGARAFLLTSSGTEGHAGHMAVVERVHSVEYDEQGEIAQIEFDGWEARSRGARHLARRTWNRVGTHGGHDVRGGLARIEVVELLAPRSGSAELPLTEYAGPSRHDAPSAMTTRNER